MNKLSTKDRAKILSVLCEGMGINAATRVTGVSKNTALKLLADAGGACAAYQDQAMRNLKLNFVQCDEIWSFVGMKQKNVPDDMKGVFGLGDVYTWTAIDSDTKLVPCWHVGTRDAESAKCFIDDLASRLANRIQLTTDGHKAKICDRWINSFENFYSDMGNAPINSSIERIDNLGNYEPSNCKWASPKEQARNRRSSILIKYKDEIKTKAEWSEITGIQADTIARRIRYKWSVEKTLETPVIAKNTKTRT